MRRNVQPTELDDLEWLISELDALRPLQTVVPFDERPGPLASITDLLRSWLETCLMEHSPALGLGTPPMNRPATLDDVFDASIALRTFWVHSLRTREDLPVNTLRLIIRQERGVFRDIAERLMTIQKPVP